MAEELGVEVVEISALKGTGVEDAAMRAIAATSKKTQKAKHSFSGSVEHAFAHIEELCLHQIADENMQRWYAIKLFERDAKVQENWDFHRKLFHILKKILFPVKKNLMMTQNPSSRVSATTT